MEKKTQEEWDRYIFGSTRIRKFFEWSIPVYIAIKIFIFIILNLIKRAY